MTLIELGIIVGEELDFSTASQGDAQVRFPNVDTKPTKEARRQSGCITGSWGGGKTKKEALADYAAELCGKWIVINAYREEERLEFQLPPVITP